MLPLHSLQQGQERLTLFRRDCGPLRRAGQALRELVTNERPGVGSVE
jgi:hypothetical protein